MNTLQSLGVVVAISIAINPMSAHTIKPPTNKVYPKFDRQVVLNHIGEMSQDLEIKINSDVEKKIRYLIRKGKSHTETVLGRSVTYFPVVESYLKKYNLPNELKFLPVVESSLDIGAKSKVGAAGPWQFMKTTGRGYGLRIDNEVDERLDLLKSSDAAARYLSDLYKRFGDWPLALAAYNCGPTRVRKAINQRRSKNFWKVKSLLPKETQDYVAKFMATAYVMSYYQFYDLRPTYKDYDQQFVTTYKFYNGCNLADLAKRAGISVKVLKELNPSYMNGLVPENPYGSYIVLPALGVNLDFEMGLLDGAFGAN